MLMSEVSVNEIPKDVLSPGKIDEILRSRKVQFMIKRLFDIVASLTGLVILLPVFLVVAVAIKLDSEGPIFFRQVRVGKDGKIFKIYKFRTMVVNAEKKGEQITVEGDRRITGIGHFLRKYKIDELPQLINVLRGDMSIVGPRPEVPKYVAMYDENQRSILRIRPGITDLASIEYKDENSILAKSDDPEKTYIKEIIPRKIELNLKYIKKMSLAYDVMLILKTILKIIR